MSDGEFIQSLPTFLTRAVGVRIAYRYRQGDGTVLVFLPGYMSDMTGGKALALWKWAQENKRAMLRLDYSGCGESDGAFADGTLSRWRDEVIAVVDAITDKPVILIGSSMGGWLMLLVARALGKRVAAMVGIAAAPDFTDWGYDESQKAEIRDQGVVYEPNPYGPEPTPTYRGLFEDGEANLMLGGEIAIDCPVRLIHGQNDQSVPWEISVRLALALRSSDVQLTLIKDGDHRLSRDQDIAMLLETVSRLTV